MIGSYVLEMIIRRYDVSSGALQEGSARYEFYSNAGYNWIRFVPDFLKIVHSNKI